jgi:hypothetical protein
MSAWKHVLIKRLTEASVSFWEVSPSMLRVSKDGQEVIVDTEALLVWPLATSRSPSRHSGGFLPLVLEVLFPEVTAPSERWEHLTLRLGAEVARLRDAVQTANEYAQLRVTELEQRLTLMQESVDSACALVAKLEDELPRRRRRQRKHRAVSVSSSESMLLEEEEDPAGDDDE